MKLKRLDLIGFKSFADRTQILFDQGVTCIVGPNGCGKSNISDAVRWVLGERSAKMLRGSKMEDVIFNGTQFRKPTALAEVALTIDNSDRGLPIDYNEVTIARRLYRSGESEYLINKTVCRLKDVQDLILDTGIGSNSYSMIEQGRIDYILSADPEERRFLIEEAAGISKYKVKKTEAVRKLERTEENRIRLNDIIKEVHKNIQYAERQARRAERYKEQLEELKSLEIRKAFYDLSSLTNERSRLEEHKKGVSEKMSSLESRIVDVRSAQEKVNETLRGILDRFSAEDGKRHNLQSRVEQIEQQLQFHQEKRVEMASRKGEIQQERKQLEERIESGKIEVESKQKEVESLSEDKSKAQETLQSSEDDLEVIQGELRSLQSENDQLKTKSAELASKTNLVRSGFHRIEAFLTSSKENRKKWAIDRDKLQDDAQEWQRNQKSYAKEIEACQQKTASLDEAISELDAKIRSQVQNSESLRQNLVGIEKELHEKQTQRKMLEEIDAGLKRKESELLDDLGKSGAVRSLKEILRIKSGYEWALELALDSLIQALVVESAAVAKDVLKQLHDKNMSALTFFIQDIKSAETPAAAPQSPHVESSLYDLLEVGKGYSTLLKSLFGDIYVTKDVSSEVLLSELLNEAGSNRFISREGIVMGPHYAVRFKNPNALAEDQIYQRRTEIEALSSAVATLEGKLMSGRHEHTKMHAAMTSLKSNLQDLEDQKVEVKVQKESLESLRATSENQLGKVQEKMDSHTRENQTTEEEIQKAKEQLKDLEGQLQESLRLENEVQEKLGSLSRKRDQIDDQRNHSFRIVAQHKARFENLDERNRLLEQSLQYLLEHEKTDHDRIQALDAEVLKIEEKDKTLISEDESLGQEKTEADHLRRDAEISLGLIRQEKKRAESELSETQSQLEGLQAEQKDFQEDLHQSEIKWMDLEYQSKTIHERLQQTYHIELSEYRAEDYPFDGDLQESESKLENLRKKVESIGTVNLLAIEEYEELKERYDFLMTQNQDLEDARGALLETIRKINRTTKSLFEETFKNAQEYFQDYYATLFKGGQARLVLLDDSNPLESGIDIIVRPPGKKLQNISLLSGGEKALTAIALLFALFKIKPSPYCVLDEVDAPLDEANIDRFLSVLRHFLKTSQFIIVTHNRKTISMGDSLFGVTMEEAGVSKLVSVRITQDEDITSPAITVNDQTTSTMAEDEILSAEEDEEEISSQSEA